MRMTYERFQRLDKFLSRPDLTPRSVLIGTRRMVRHLIALGSYWDTLCGQGIAEAAKGLPFSAKRHDVLAADRRKINRDFSRMIRELAEALLHFKPFIQQTMSFEQIADVLAINSVHRAEARACYEESGLLGILFTDRFEDSSIYRDRTDNSGWLGMGPLSEAVMLYMVRWMAENSDKLPDPFAPDGPFYGAATYMCQPDGSMVRQPPALTVHSADGTSRVIKRKAGVTHD